MRLFSPAAIGLVGVMVCVAAAGLVGRSTTDLDARPASVQEAPARDLVVDVLSAHPHDRTSYTQGLLFHEGRLFESAGRRGESDVREVDLRTGRVLRERPLDDTFFAEGLANVGERLIQLTWEAGVAFQYDLNTFEPLGTLPYEGEGWGLCYDGERLVMSDGGPTLEFRDPVTFEPLGEVSVRLDGEPLLDLNELECVDGAVYANVWTQTFIVRIDPSSGEVTDRIDAAIIDDDFRIRTGNDNIYDTLNGIAFDQASGTFYVTGKYWDQVYGVRFIPRAERTPGPVPTVDTSPTAPPPPEGGVLYAPYARPGR